jgi:hypothetical protein
MRGRKPIGITLPPEHVAALQQLVRSGKTEQRVARRARILLAMHLQERVGPLAEHMEQHRTTVWRLCQRYKECGLEAVVDAPRTRARRLTVSRNGHAATLCCGA